MRVRGFTVLLMLVLAAGTGPQLRAQEAVQDAATPASAQSAPPAATVSGTLPEFGLRVHVGGETVDASSMSALPAELVVLVHGLDEPGTCWKDVVPALQGDALTVCEFVYPNDQTVPASAVLLHAALAAAHGRGARRVDLVSHSMGGLVSRELLTSPDGYAGTGSAHADLPDVRRLIMVAPPNHGSQLARFRLASETREQAVKLFGGQWSWRGALANGHGEAGIDLLPDSAFLRRLNARPAPTGVVLTILAGRSSPVTRSHVDELIDWGRSHGAVPADALEGWKGSLRALEDGSGDGAVALESARLEGVDDVVVLAANHLSLIERGWGAEPPPAIAEIRARLAPLPAGDGKNHSRENHSRENH